jgi:outer membrane protein OmpA-like peptidoglycan-associated protein
MRSFLVAASLTLVTVAHAQSAIDVVEFHPPATSNGFVSVDGGFVAPHLGFSAGLFLSYAHDPLVLRQNGKVPTGGELIKHQLSMDLVASFAVIGRLELGVDLPFVPTQSVDNSVAKLPDLHATALGDLRIDLKGLLWAPRTHGHRFALAVIAGLTAPTGDATSFTSAHTVAGRFLVIGEWRAPWLRVALELGTVVQPQHQYLDLYVGTQLTYGAGASVPLPLGFMLLGEVAGRVGVALPAGVALTGAEAPGEARLGLGWRARFGLELLVAGGSGITRGYGTPDGRFIFGLRYTTPAREPIEGNPVTIEPGVTARPARPVTQATDSDGDSVPDNIDACPDRPGPASNAGCPLTDSDGDGVPDVEDRCPQQPGSRQNEGCPDVDSDGDGIVDRLDKCPFDPEVFNGVDDDDGCPDQPAALATVSGKRIAIAEPILFENNSAAIDKRSFKLLGIVAHILRLHTEILKVSVEGHTDNKGAPLELLELSRARAAAVRRWLIDNGQIDGRRLTAQGFGRDKPIADNRDFVGRSKNRRIEFVITAQRLDGN